MKNIKNILVGVDVKEGSSKVIRRALILAKKNNAHLSVVHAIPTPWFDVPSYFGSEDISVDTKSIVKKIDKKIKRLNTDNIPYNILVKEGRIDDILLYESKLLKADMMIIGASGKKKAKKSFLGTIAQKIAYQSEIPVLIVKNSVKEAYKNIIAPTDFQRQSEQSIVFAKNIFPSAKITLLHAFEVLYLIDGPYTYTMIGRDYTEYYNEAKSGAKRVMKDLMKKVSVDDTKVIDGQLDSKDELVDYINAHKYDLAVVGAGGSRAAKALLGSVANHILREAKSDVLLYIS